MAQDGQIKVVPQPSEWDCTGAPVCLATCTVDSQAPASGQLTDLRTAWLTMQPRTRIVYLVGWTRVDGSDWILLPSSVQM